MLKASLDQCARHQRVQRVLVLLFQCVCVFTLFSTVCYIVDIRSRYHTPRLDFPALGRYTESLWSASALPARLGAADVASPKLFAPLIQTRDEPSAQSLNASLTRSGALAASTEGYNLERIECLWSAAFEPAPAPPAAVRTLPLHLHVFFLHGNAGSHRQGEYWSCAVQHAGSLLGVMVSTYAFRWNEQANVHRGRLMSVQADYTADVVEAVVRAATAAAANKRTTHRVWFGAHSMGGIVARLAAQLLDSSIDLGGIVTFNAPHRFPPLLLDAPMADIFRTLTVAEQMPASGVDVDAVREDAMAAQRQLSSAELVHRFRAMTPRCLRQTRHQSPAAQLISITSGEMDLQIEPATALPPPFASHYAVSFFNTLDQAVCTGSASHDGVLTDPCAVAFGALRLLAASVNQTQGSAALSQPLGSVEFAAASARAQLPLPPGIVSRVSLVGQLLWQQHMWPWGVAALYGYVLFAGLWPQMVRSAGSFVLRGPARRASAGPAASVVRWMASSDYSVAIFLVVFYSCTTVYSALTALYLACTGQLSSFGATRPWQWETFPQLRHTSAGVAAPVHFFVFTFVFLLTSVGPATVGINAGMTLLAVGDVMRHVKERMGRCRRMLGTARRRRAAAALFPAFVVALYVLFLVQDISLTVRAIVWLVLFLTVPSFRDARARREEQGAAVTAAYFTPPKRGVGEAVEVVFPADVSTVRSANETDDWYAQHLPGMVYAALYLLQLHPFFTVRNAIVSHTVDSVSTVDWRNFAAEGGLLVLLCCAAATPSLPMGRLRLWRYMGLLTSVVSALAVAWLVVHPVECFLVLPTLLWCLPSFLFSTLCA